MPANWLFWVLFHVFVLAALALDLGVFHRKARVISFREALAWTAIWIALATLFAVLIYLFGHVMTGRPERPTRVLTLEFITGYVVEEALSVDNLFVFLVIFNYFAVPEAQQHRVLFFGVLGALVMRGIFIGAGVGLLSHVHWVLYIFGGLLIVSGIRFLVLGEHKVDPSKNPLVKTLRRFVPVTPDYQGGKFFIRKLQENSRLYATPLLVVLLVIETTDIVFSVDSIPAILAITLNGFIVYTSNVFAILGLRSMYFAVSGLMKIFRFLRYGLALVLILVGVKMLAADYFRVPIGATLGVVAGVLLLSIAISVAFPATSKA